MTKNKANHLLYHAVYGVFAWLIVMRMIPIYQRAEYSGVLIRSSMTNNASTGFIVLLISYLGTH